MVSFTLQQVTAIVATSKYQVTNSASDSVYVFKTIGQTFSHYASAADMAQWLPSYEQAFLLNQPFYRLPLLVRTWDTVARMNEDLSTSLRRLQSLADELYDQQGSLIVNRTTVVVGC